MPALLAVPVQAALAVTVICVLITGTAWVVSRCLNSEDDRDGIFWYGFTGGFACLGAILGAMALVPEAAAVTGLGGMLGAGLAAGWVWRGAQERAVRRRRQLVDEARSALRSRHETVLQRWVSYELDPAVAIDYPDMTDLHRPETARLVRAMRRAALLREQQGSGGPTEEAAEGELPAYEEAVRGLETAFEAAERAAGAHSTAPRKDR